MVGDGGCGGYGFGHVGADVGFCWFTVGGVGFPGLVVPLCVGIICSFYVWWAGCGLIGCGLSALGFEVCCG